MIPIMKRSVTRQTPLDIRIGIEPSKGGSLLLLPASEVVFVMLLLLVSSKCSPKLSEAEGRVGEIDNVTGTEVSVTSIMRLPLRQIVQISVTLVPEIG
jgi:hypothetical protein